jgi:hypothetical protein
MANIKIVQKGPSGTVQYTEGLFKKNRCEFYFEFGGGNTVATIWFPAEDQWDANYRWAAGRQKEIVTAVAEEVRRTQAPSANIKWETDRFHLVQ